MLSLRHRNKKSLVNNCARCGENHSVVFYRLVDPIVIDGYDYEWEGTCPTTNQPVFASTQAEADYNRGTYESA